MLKRLLFLSCLLASLDNLLPSVLPAAERGQRVVEATYKITDAATAATCFLLERPKPDNKGSQILLVTAAHVLENFKGEQARLILRKPKGPDEIEMVSWPFRIRNGDKPIWVKHRDTDVAALAIDPPADLRPKTLPVDILATADAWNKAEFEPGDAIRLVGYPHALLFEPNPQGYPTTRLGALAGFPLKPSEKSRMFLVDCNVFEGDSGGPIYFLGEKPADGGPRPLMILGLLHGQHFLNENIRTAYQTGEFRHRFGIGMVVYSQSIIEAIDQVPKE